MITIKNNQRKISIDKEFISKTAQIILDELKYSDFDLGILFTTNEKIRILNRDYRQKDKATDILSFANHQLKAGQRIKTDDEDEKNLGDLIISASFVNDLLPLYETTFNERIAVLLVHGVCHLLGYTHYDSENDKKMIALENKLFKKLALQNIRARH